ELDIRISVGIDYGPILVSDGSDCFGNPVNGASKLGEDIAAAGEILVTREAMAQVPPNAVAQRALTFSASGIQIDEVAVSAGDPQPIRQPWVNYIVLGASFVFEGISWRIALQKFRAVKVEGSYFEAMHQSKDPTSFMVLLEDSAALIGIAIALAGTIASVALEAPIFDALASIAIGLLLGATALFLAYETKGLLIGERTAPRTTRP